MGHVPDVAGAFELRRFTGPNLEKQVRSQHRSGAWMMNAPSLAFCSRLLCSMARSSRSFSMRGASDLRGVRTCFTDVPSGSPSARALASPLGTCDLPGSGVRGWSRRGDGQGGRHPGPSSDVRRPTDSTQPEGMRSHVPMRVIQLNSHRVSWSTQPKELHRCQAGTGVWLSVAVDRQAEPRS